METARQLQQLMARGEYLDPPQLKLKLLEVIKQTKFAAEAEFKLLDFYDNYLRLHHVQPKSVQPKQISMESMFALAAQMTQEVDRVPDQPLQCLEERQRLLIDLHNALIKICVLSDQMRQNRLNLIADMIE